MQQRTELLKKAIRKAHSQLVNGESNYRDLYIKIKKI